MKILYISQYFPPEMGAPSARVVELGRHWVGAGHEVTVLTGFPNHPTGRVHPDYRKAFRRLFAREQVDGIDVVRTWLVPLPNRRPHERIVNYGSFFISAVVRGLALRRPDVVIATSPQLLVGLAGWIVAVVKRRPVILEIRDIWPDAIIASGVGSDRSALARFLRALSRFLYRRCSHVVVVTPAFKTELTKRWGVDPDKITVVTNGVETDLFAPRDPHAAKKAVGLDGKFVVSYIGTIGLAHGLATVLEAATVMRTDTPDVIFVIAGDGADKDDLMARVERDGLDNVRFVAQQPREQVPELIGGSDVCLVLLKQADIFKTVIPTKMLEFMACARPVVLGVDGQARSILEAARAGIFIEPESAVALERAIRRLKKDDALRAELGRNGRTFAVDNLSRAQTATQYVSVIERVISARDSVAKRILDVTLASVGLILSAPLWAIVAIAVKVDDRGPIFYRQTRWGRGRARFGLYKFRTMTADSDERFGITQAREDDERVTRVGRRLRAMGLDELPQFLNILRGDMSFVGPRALAIGEQVTDESGNNVGYESIPGFAERLVVRPGLTGMATIYVPKDTDPVTKLGYDLRYIRERTMWLDIKLILLSLWISVRGRWETRQSKL